MVLYIAKVVGGRDLHVSRRLPIILKYFGNAFEMDHKHTSVRITCFSARRLRATSPRVRALWPFTLLQTRWPMNSAYSRRPQVEAFLRFGYARKASSVMCRMSLESLGAGRPSGLRWAAGPVARVLACSRWLPGPCAWLPCGYGCSGPAFAVRRARQCP